MDKRQQEGCNPKFDALNHIRWALPETLILQTYDVPLSNSIPKLIFGGQEHRSDGYGISKKDSESTVEISKEERADLWVDYKVAINDVKKDEDDDIGATTCFEWLDANKRLSSLEFRVYRRMRRQIESSLRKRLEWIARKLKQPVYMKAAHKYQDLIPFVVSSKFKGPAKLPPDVDAALSKFKEGTVALNHTSLIRSAVSYGKTPHMVPSRPRGFKGVYQEALDSVRKRKYRARKKGEVIANGISGERDLEDSGTEDHDEPIDEDDPDDSAQPPRKRGKARKLRAPGEVQVTHKKINRSVSKQRKAGPAASGSSEDQDDASDDEMAASKRRRMKKGGKNPNPKGGTRDSNGHLKSAGKAKITDWSVRPVTVKRKWNEYYSKSELTLMRTFARKNYTFDSDIKEKADISISNEVIDQGPNLSAPIIVRLIMQYLRHKRWRLLDLFTCSDKNKTWKLNQFKIRMMCDTLGFSDVTVTTIMDFMVALVEGSNNVESITYKDLKTGIKEWVRENRVRKRYCTAMDNGTMECDQSVTNIVGIDGEKPLDTATVMRVQLARENAQSCMPPDDIGTEVCDVAGLECQWHSVFPESLVLSWRIQQRLKMLARTGRWLAVQNILAVFGDQRKLSPSALDIVSKCRQEAERLQVEVRNRPKPPVAPEKSSSVILKEQRRRKATLEGLAAEAPSSEVFDRESAIKPQRSLNEQEILKTGAFLTHGELVKSGRVVKTFSDSRASQSQFEVDGQNEHFHSPKRRKSADNYDGETHELTELDTYLHKHFRENYSAVKVDPMPASLLQSLQIRAARLLKACSEAKARQALSGMDSEANLNEPVRSLLKEIGNLTHEASNNLRMLYQNDTEYELRRPTGISTERPAVQFQADQKSSREKLLQEMRATVPWYARTCFSPKEKLLVSHIRRLASSRTLLDTKASNSSLLSKQGAPVVIGVPRPSLLNLTISHKSLILTSVKPKRVEEDGCGLVQSRAVLRTISSRLLNATLRQQNRELQDPLPVLDGGAFEENISDILKRKASATGNDEYSRTKADMETERLEQQLDYLLDTYLAQEKDVLIQGLTESAAHIAAKMRHVLFHNPDFVKRKVLVSRQLNKAQQDYMTVVRRAMKDDYQKAVKRTNGIESTLLKTSLIRPEDYEFQPPNYAEQLKRFKSKLPEQLPGGQLPKRWARKRLTRSLPNFLPLAANRSLLLSSIAKEITID